MQPIRILSADAQGARIEVYPARFVNGCTDRIDLISSAPACEKKWTWCVEAFGDDILTVALAINCWPWGTSDYIRMELVTDNWQPPRSGKMFSEWKGHGTSLDFRLHLPTLKDAGYIFEGAVRVRIRAGQERARAHMNIGCIFGCSDFSDLTVASAGKEWQVHRSILAAHSPVLKSLICTNMSERNCGRLEISDFSAATMDAFLRFLYTEDVSIPWQCDDLPEGPWCDPFLDNEVYPASSTDLMFTCGDVKESCKFTVVRQENGDLMWHGDKEWLGHEDLQFVVDTSAAIPTKWKCVNSIDLSSSSLGAQEIDKIDHIVFENWQLVIGNIGGTTKCVCKDGEKQFAQFWGRLLVAADKYCVHHLIRLCVETMMERISIWSAAVMLKFACEANQQLFKRDIMTFMTLTGDLFRSVKDMADFDDLSMDLRDELTEVFLDRRRPNSSKRKTVGDKEFVDGQDWLRLSSAQLRRACAERGLATCGSREHLATLLRAQEL